MSFSRRFEIKSNTSIAKCPKCGNNTSFVAHSFQFAEDCCNVWVTCRCGYDPSATNTSHRMEDVWGSLDNDTIGTALRWCWHDVIAESVASLQAHA